MMRTGAFTLLLLLAASSASAAPEPGAPGPGLSLLSLVGEATLDGAPLKGAGGVVAEKKTLVLARGAVAQLVMGAVAVGVVGPARLTPEDPFLGGLSFSGPGAMRLAGGPAVVSWSGWKVAPRAGAVMLLAPGKLYVTSGMVNVSRAGGARRQVRAGQGVALLSDGKTAPVQGPPPAALHADAARYQPPPPRAPPPGELDLEDIQRAEGTAQRERQAQRETAACGCTEGGGAGEGVGDGKSGGTSTPETFTAPVRITVRGVPKGAFK